MRREEFQQHFSDYRKYLREEIHRFRDCVAVYRQIQERKTDMLEVINQSPAFFGIAESALFTSIVLWGDKLFDEKGERGLFNFLTFVEYERKWLTTAELQRRKGYPDGHWAGARGSCSAKVQPGQEVWQAGGLHARIGASP